MQDTIPSQDSLRKEIIQILITEWHFTEVAAIRESTSPVLHTARRKYHFKRALGKVDQFTPSFPRLYPGDAEMFGTDEAASYWLSRQTPEAYRNNMRGSQNAKTRSVTKARRRASYSGSAQESRQRAHQASL